MGYVGQFPCVIPRVATVDIVAEPLHAQDVDEAEARSRACESPARLALPERLWSMPPATFPSANGSG